MSGATQDGGGRPMSVFARVSEGLAPVLALALWAGAGSAQTAPPARVVSMNLCTDQLALMLAISRQTTNQILKELEAQGILRLTYGEIELLDLPRLRQAAQ